MFENTELDNNSEKGYLIPGYNFLTEKGFGNEVKEIKESQDKFMQYTTTLRRGKIIDLLEKNNLLEEFIEKCWKNGNTELGKKEILRVKRILSRFNDSIDSIEENENEEIYDSSFAYEDDLRDYLANNLSIIETGLKLFVDSEGKNGIEYSVDKNNKRIDILAIDKENKFVVIELKVSQGYEKVIGQALYYKSMIKEIFNQKDVRIIILAKEITIRLQKAVEDLPFVELYEYSLSVNVKKV